MWIALTILFALLSLVLFIENRYLSRELNSTQYALTLLIEDKLNREE